MDSGMCFTDSPRGTELFRSGRKEIAYAADGSWGSGTKIPGLSVTSEECTEQP